MRKTLTASLIVAAVMVSTTVVCVAGDSYYYRKRFNASPVLKISDSSPPAAARGDEYNNGSVWKPKVSGGVPPYEMEFSGGEDADGRSIGSGFWNGLSFNQNGIFGVPQAATQLSGFLLTVKDAAGHSVSQSLDLKVLELAATVSAMSPSTGTVGEDYSKTVAAITGGTSPYVSVTALRDSGESLDALGLQTSIVGNNILLSGSSAGKPTAAGSWTGSFVVTDSASRASLPSNKITINVIALLTKPEPFSFQNLTKQKLATVVQSNIVKISGINTPVSASTSGSSSELRVCKDSECLNVLKAWASSTTIENDQYLQVRQTTAQKTATDSAAIVTVGTADPVTWKATTEAGMCSWTPLTDPGIRNWLGVASSADGSRLLAGAMDGSLHQSTDSGLSWSRITAGLPVSSGWYGVAISADGSTFVAAAHADYIYVSRNGGASWVKKTAPGAKWWRGLTVSADGSVIAAAAYGEHIWISRDYGNSWVASSTAVGKKNWAGLGISSDGQHIVAGADGEYIYTSDNGGQTWTVRTGAGTGAWLAVAASGDGMRIIIGSYATTGRVWTSTNRGQSWTMQSALSARSWFATASSADGTRLMVASKPKGEVYASVDGAASFKKDENAPIANWYYTASSYDGRKVLAGTDGGYLYRAVCE